MTEAFRYFEDFSMKYLFEELTNTNIKEKMCVLARRWWHGIMLY